MPKIDFHTHSIASPDGGLTSHHYQRALECKLLDYIAITDHNTAEFALSLHAKLGEYIIVGEEIMTDQGEIIGLYLQQTIKAPLRLDSAVQAIEDQGGLIYIPHPFETKRKGLSQTALQAIIEQVAIVETHNGRAWGQSCTSEAITWAAQHEKAAAGSSDAHGWHGLGGTYTVLASAPTRDTLVSLVRRSVIQVRSPGLRAILYPSLHRLRNNILHI